jgi:membrane protein insertase Oxa1/YidC/SpoIIIJ
MKDPFVPIDLNALENVSGGVVKGSAQVASIASSDPLMNALTAIETELQSFVTAQQQQNPVQQFMQQWMKVMFTNSLAPRPNSGRGS